MARDWKENEVEELEELIEENPVIGMINMHKLPAPQLQEIRKDLHGKAKIRMSRKTLMKLALKDSDKEDIRKLKDHMQGESAFIVTSMNPFKLYNYLQKNKSSAPAKPGDIAPNDIVVTEGSTGIDPGPAIGKLQSVGLQTSIQEGKIYVDEDSVVVEEGEEVGREESEALKMLEMEPMEIGLNLKALWEDGVIFDKEKLQINEEEYLEGIKNSWKRSLSLSIAVGYLNEENISLLIRKSENEAKALALKSNFLTEDTINDQLSKILFEGKALKSTVEEVS